VVAHAATCASLVCAGYVFANWRYWDKFPASLNRVGSIIADFQLPLSSFGINWQLEIGNQKWSVR